MKSEQHRAAVHGQDDDYVLPPRHRLDTPDARYGDPLGKAGTDWPCPSYEVDLPVPDCGLELERLQTAVEIRLADAANYAEGEAGGYVLGITSAVSGEGKTTVATALAATMGRNSEQRVCLVDLSLSQPGLGEQLNLPKGKSCLMNVLDGHDEVPDTVRVSGCHDLILVPAGRKPAHPAKTVRSSRLAAFLQLARRHFDLVIVDLPAVATNHVLPMSKHLDGLILVSYAAVTPKGITKQAVNSLDPTMLLGLVLNRVPPPVTQKLLKRS